MEEGAGGEVPQGTDEKNHREGVVEGQDHTQDGADHRGEGVGAPGPADQCTVGLAEVADSGGEEGPHEEADHGDHHEGGQEAENQGEEDEGGDQGEEEEGVEGQEEGDDQGSREEGPSAQKLGDSPREEASQTGGEEEGEDDHRDGVGGVAQEELEDLDEDDLHHDVAEADEKEVEDSLVVGPGGEASPAEGEVYEEKREEKGEGENGEVDGVGVDEAPFGDLFGHSLGVVVLETELTDLVGLVDVGRVVPHRGHQDRGIPINLFGTVGGEAVVDVVHGPVGAVDNVVLLGELRQLGDLFTGEVSLLEEEEVEAPLGLGDEELLLRLGNLHLPEGLVSCREEPLPEPVNDGDVTVVVHVAPVILEAFDSVDVGFRYAQPTGEEGVGVVGVDHLNDVELLVQPFQDTASLVVDQLDPSLLEEVPDIGRVLPLHDVADFRVHLHGDDPLEAVR